MEKISISSLDDTIINVYDVKIVSYPSGKVIQNVGLKLTERQFHEKMAQITYNINERGLSFRPGKKTYLEIESELLGPYIEPEELERRIKALRQK